MSNLWIGHLLLKNVLEKVGFPSARFPKAAGWMDHVTPVCPHRGWMLPFCPWEQPVWALFTSLVNLYPSGSC